MSNRQETFVHSFLFGNWFFSQIFQDLHFMFCNKSHKYCTLRGLQRIFKIHDNSILFFLIQRKKDTFDIKCWHALLWNPVSKGTWKMALNAQIKSKTLARSLLRCFFSKLDSEEFFYFLKKVHVFHFEWCAFVQVCWYIFFSSLHPADIGQIETMSK